MPSPFYIVCFLVALLREVCLSTGLGCAEQELEANASDSSDLEELRAGKGRYKRGSPWSTGVDAIPLREPK